MVTWTGRSATGATASGSATCATRRPRRSAAPARANGSWSPSTAARWPNSGRSARTTDRIERFSAPLAGMGVLRANAACLPSPRWRKLPAAVRREQLAIGREVLHALIETCRPAAILCHGVVGVRAVSGLFGTALDPRVSLERQDVRAALAPGGAPVRLFAYPHLSGMGARGFRVGHMTGDVEALGRRLARELGA